MNQANSLKWIGALAALGSWCLCVGCGRGSSPAVSQTTDARSPRALAVFYQEFQEGHGGRPPKDEAEFREFLGTLSARLEAGGLTADKVLTSPKSSNAWVVGYGTPIKIDGVEYIAYESAAVEGKRGAINARGAVESIDDAKFESLAPGKP
jgi:hypothetical protein